MWLKPQEFAVVMLNVPRTSLNVGISVCAAISFFRAIIRSSFRKLCGGGEDQTLKGAHPDVVPFVPISRVRSNVGLLRLYFILLEAPIQLSVSQR